MAGHAVFHVARAHLSSTKDGNTASLSPGPTMDIALIRELFSHCIEAERILGTWTKISVAIASPPRCRSCRRIRSTATAILQEWIEDWAGGPEGHNVSPNFPFFPGSTITLRGNPGTGRRDQQMDGNAPGSRRLDHRVGHRRLGAIGTRRKSASSGSQALMRNSLADNLHNRRNNQSDANFGLTAAIAEALVQSHAGEISLLPALPPSWSSGSVSGLRARGGFEVAIEWKDGKLVAAAIHSAAPGACTVRYGPQQTRVSIMSGQTMRVGPNLSVIE